MRVDEIATLACIAFDRQLSPTRIEFELVQTVMRVDESLCAFVV
jgi:hypothetical protein